MHPHKILLEEVSLPTTRRSHLEAVEVEGRQLRVGDVLRDARVGQLPSLLAVGAAAAARRAGGGVASQR